MPNLLDALSDSENTIDLQDENLITPIHEFLEINPEKRLITIPESEQLFGVYGENKVEIKYFKCPRIILNDIDLYECYIFINYISASGKIGYIQADTVVLDETENYIIFTWELTRNVFDENTDADIYFSISAKQYLEDKEPVFFTRKAKGNLYETVYAEEQITEQYADIILQLLAEMDGVKQIATPEAINVQKVDCVVDVESDSIGIIDIGCLPSNFGVGDYIIDSEETIWKITSIDSNAIVKLTTDDISQVTKNTIKIDKLSEEIADKITTPTSAKVGQILEVETVDDTGKPLSWKVVDKPTGSGESGDTSTVDVCYVTPQMFGAIGNANYFNEDDKQWYVDEEFTTLANDDTQAFKDALTEAENGTLYIPKGQGEYYLVGRLYLKNNLKIVAEKGAKIVFKWGTDAGLTIHDKHDITIDGNGTLELLMKRGAFTSSTQHTIYMLRSKNIEIKNLIVRDSEGDGVYIGGASDYAYNEHITLKNLQIYNSKRNNISITHGKHIIIDSCILNDIQAEDSQAPQGGLDIEANNNCVCEDIYVVNCIANNNKGNGYYCVRACKNVVFENCIAIDNAYNFGIDGTELGYLAKDITCINCLSVDTKGTIKDGFSTSKAENVKFIDCTSEGCGIGFGFYNKSVGIIANSCTSKDSRANGFHIETPNGNMNECAKDIVISGCVIQNSGENGFLLKHCDNVNVKSCVITDSLKHAIQIKKARNCIIDGNTLTNSALCGIFVDDSTDTLIQGNFLNKNKACGVLVTGNRAMIENNYLLNNAIYDKPEGEAFAYYYAGIKIQAGNDCIIKNNKVRITEEYDTSKHKPYGISIQLYGKVTNCYIAQNDVYNGGYFSYEITGSTDYGNVDGGGNRKKDGTILTA